MVGGLEEVGQYRHGRAYRRTSCEPGHAAGRLVRGRGRLPENEKIPRVAVWRSDLEPGHKVGILRSTSGFLDAEACTPWSDCRTPLLRTLVRGLRNHHEQRRGPDGDDSRTQP